MVKRRTGLDPLAYMGVEPSMPAQFVREGRNPTTTDYEGYNIGTVWIVKGTNAVWMLVDKALFIATWRQFTAGVSALNTLTGDVGGIVPATANNIDIFGSGPYLFTGNPGMSLLTLSDNGTLATQYDADIGSAIPVANIINIIGGPHVQTTAAGNTITISPMGSVAVSIPTDAGVAAPAAGVLNVFGLAGRNISTSGAGNTVSVAVSGTTNNALQRGNATGSLTSLTVGTNGQVVIGATGGAPAFATLASAGGTILFTPGANTLNLESAGAGALTSIPCDIGAAAPLLSVLNAFGGDNITTTGAGNTVTIAVSGTTQFAPQMGNAAGSLDDIGLMTNGELIIGSTGLAPQINTLTAGTGISITNAAGSITIDATGGSTGGVVRTVFNASGMWTKNANTKSVKYIIMSAGQGGGSGARGIAALGTYNSGGGGGAYRGSTTYDLDVDRLGATETVTIGAGGVGGAAQTVDSTAGNFGGDSGISYFGSLFALAGGDPRTNSLAALGGFVNRVSNTTSSGGHQGSTYYYLASISVVGTAFGGNGSTGIGLAPAFATFSYYSPTPAGGGGGASNNTAVFAGGNSGQVTVVGPAGLTTDVVWPATLGGAAGVSGANGDDADNINIPYSVGGYGGGGGGGHATNPGSGGDGGFPGGPGGGGGACFNGSNSGAGGDGNGGQVIIYEYLG